MKEKLNELYYTDRNSFYLIKLFVDYLRKKRCLGRFIWFLKQYHKKIHAFGTKYDVFNFDNVAYPNHSLTNGGIYTILAEEFFNYAFVWTWDREYGTSYWTSLSVEWREIVRNFCDEKHIPYSL